MQEDLPTTVGERLKWARRQRQLTQVELSDKAGVSQQLVSHLEKGATEQSMHLPHLADALQISLEWLATGRGEMEPLTALSAEERHLLPGTVIELAKALWRAGPKKVEAIATLLDVELDAKSQARKTRNAIPKRAGGTETSKGRLPGRAANRSES